MLATPDDVVTQYLKAQGLSPQVAYFENSDFLLGWKVEQGDLELVYRLDDDQLIVCDLSARTEPSGGKQAVLQFIRLIHQLQKNVPQVQSVCGMFIEKLSQPELTAMRRRLAQALEAEGAHWEEREGQPWLVYPMQ